MKRIEALKTASEIAVLIYRGVIKLKHTTLQNAPLMARLPFIKFSSEAKKDKDLDIESLNPHIYEILVYGSTAVEDNSQVGDIDMIIIDSGFFSNFFHYRSGLEDRYLQLSDNLRMLLNEWFEMDEAAEVYFDTPVDLQIFPDKLFKSESLRTEILSKHKDPNFFKNCFSDMLRYDSVKRTFVPVDVSYFEERFSTALTDLRKC